MIGAARAIGAVLFLALLPAGAAPAAPAVKTATGTDWARKFSITGEGGYRVGNPKAKLAIVEYGSLVCSHCRHFAQTAMKPLSAGYIRTGKASYEFRPLILNGLDMAATLVARCSGPTRFFPIADELFATQPKWTSMISEDQYAKLIRLPQAEMLVAVAKLSGLNRVAEAHGIAPSKAQSCLKSKAAAESLAKMTKAANDRGIRATPTFFVNGNRANAYDWATLEPLLKQAGG